MDGIPSSAVFTQTIPEGATGSSPVSLQCNLMPGEHTFSVQVRVEGDSAIVQGRTVDVVGWRPPWNPP